MKTKLNKYTLIMINNEVLIAELDVKEEQYYCTYLCEIKSNLDNIIFLKQMMNTAIDSFRKCVKI